MMPDPATISIIHEHMISEFTEQPRPPRRPRRDSEEPDRRRVGAARHITARALRTLARRLEPAPVIEPPMSPTKPVL